MSSDKKRNKVLLIVAYSERNLGIRFISNNLLKNGFEPTIVFFKTFETLYNSPIVTEEELNLLKGLIEKENYLFVGLNLHSSSIIQSVDKVINLLQNVNNLPFIIGGAYPTVNPKYCATKADMVLRGDGEKTIIELAKALQENKDWRNIPGACFFNEKDEYVEIQTEDLVTNLDSIAYPVIGYEKMYLINYDSITQIDPQLTTDFYETSTSRGCPFHCSYCCNDALSNIYKKGTFLRYRSVDSVIKELTEAIQKNPNIKEIRFWDEVFPSDEKWIKEFSSRFKKEIGLKFHIFGHPLMIKENNIKTLVDAGLYVIAVGFQSGSPNIRNNIFNRAETNEQIINASKILSKCKVPKVYYDLMIGHALESLDEIKETFELCLRLEHPFKLQLHGLGILPGAKIINTLVKNGIYTKNEINKITTSSFEEQDAFLLGPYKNNFWGDERKSIWASLIYLTQFPEIREEVLHLSLNPYKNKSKINKLKCDRKLNHPYIKRVLFCDYENLYDRPMNIVKKFTKSVFDKILKKD